MKRTLMILAVLVVLLSGCSGVIMNAEYSRLLDQTVMLSSAIANTAETGAMSELEMAAALRAHATAWKQFQAARDGKVSK